MEVYVLMFASKYMIMVKNVTNDIMKNMIKLIAHYHYGVVVSVHPIFVSKLLKKLITKFRDQNNILLKKLSCATHRSVTI